MRPESAALLWDVHNAAARIAEFIAGVDSDAYTQDELRRSAVERQLEIVGDSVVWAAATGTRTTRRRRKPVSL